MLVVLFVVAAGWDDAKVLHFSGSIFWFGEAWGVQQGGS